MFPVQQTFTSMKITPKDGSRKVLRSVNINVASVNKKCICEVYANICLSTAAIKPPLYST